METNRKFSLKLEQDYPQARKYFVLYNLIWGKIERLLEKEAEKQHGRK